MNTNTLNSEIQTIDLAKYNGEITITNPETGNHRTFRIRTMRKDSKFAPGERIIELLDGPDNEDNYRGFAFVKGDGRVIVWTKKRGGVFDAYARMLSNPDPYQERGIIYQMSIRCRVCSRKLTDPLSISLGIGPKCRGDK